MAAPLLFETRAALIDALRRGDGRLALVPTMGALHEGHRALFREARRRAARVAVSIFVNPTQFGPTEDFARYPRDLDADLESCAREGVELVYAPKTPDELYPSDFSTWVEPGELATRLCGASRPGHFRGVATVVAKLLCVFRPDVAIFGQKDYQQLAIIRRLARDLELDAWTEIVGAATVREAGGLALSSRNRYLSAQERARALGLYESLRAAQTRYEAGERSGARLVDAARTILEGRVDRVEYLELVDADSLAHVEDVRGPVCLLVAAHVGATRLIDNVVLGR